MSDFIVFDEGADQLLAGGKGLPVETSFLLSTKAVGTEAAAQHKHADTYEGGVGRITGTEYADKKEVTPAATGTGEGNREVTFAQMIWATGAHTDWQEAKSVVAFDSTTKKAICAWNLQTGGAGRVLGAANTEEKVTPSLLV